MTSNSWCHLLAEWAWAGHLTSLNSSLKGGQYLSAHLVIMRKMIQCRQTVGLRTKSLRGGHIHLFNACLRLPEEKEAPMEGSGDSLHFVTS